MVGEFLVELVEGAAAEIAVGFDQEGAEAALAEFDLLAGAVGDEAELEVDVSELGEGFLVSGQRLRTHGEEAFLIFVEGMRLEAAEACEDGAPGGEFRRGGEGGELCVGNGHQLGAEV